MRSVVNAIINSVFKFYSWVLSPLLHLLFGAGGGCRFHPTCSVYSRDALLRHGVLKGSWLTIKRLLRCQPFSKGGYDPVP